MFYNARWYDPALGRFSQADTIIPGGAQGLDRYAYVNNSPLKYIDPSGHDSVCGSTYSDPECDKPDSWRLLRPHFTTSPVSSKDLEWTQWFGGTEFAYQGGSSWGYDDYCQGFHCGIDFGADWGDPIVAGVDGEVISLGKGDGGYFIVIETENYQILYQALDGNFLVEVGDIVTPETIIAGVGNHDADENGGNNHLHLEVMYSSTGDTGYKDRIVNPLLYMDQSIYSLLTSVVPYSPINNVTFHTEEQNPLLQISPIHRGAPVLWP